MPYKAVVAGKCFDTSGRPAPGLTVQAWMVVPGSPALLLMGTSGPTSADGAFEMTLQVQADPTSPSPTVVLQALQGQRPIPCRPAALVFQGAGAERKAWGDIMLLEALGGSLNDLNIAEIGQGLASVAGSIQQELGRYPVAGGVYVLDEFELSVPVRLRVDEVGQIRAAVLPEKSQVGGGELRLKIRPVLEVPAASLGVTSLPLEALEVLGKRQMARLRDMRVFDVASLLRLINNPTSQTALKPLQLPLDKVRERAELLLYAGIPEAVARLLIKNKIASIREFLLKSPADIWQLLPAAMRTEILPEDIDAWQAKLRPPSPEARAKARAARP